MQPTMPMENTSPHPLDGVIACQSAMGGIDTRAQLRKREEAGYLLFLCFYILAYRFCLIHCTNSSFQASPSVILTVAAWRQALVRDKRAKDLANRNTIAELPLARESTIKRGRISEPTRYEILREAKTAAHSGDATTRRQYCRAEAPHIPYVDVLEKAIGATPHSDFWLPQVVASEGELGAVYMLKAH